MTLTQRSTLQDVLKVDISKTPKAELIKLSKDVLCELILHFTSTRTSSSPKKELDNPVIPILQTLSDELKQQISQSEEKLNEVMRKNEESIIHRVEDIMKSARYFNDGETNLHVTPPPPSCSPPQISPYIHHDDNFLENSFANELLSFCKDQTFDIEGGHSVISFGEQYLYSSADRPTPAPIPEVMNKLIAEIKDKFPDCPAPNACLINKYSGPNAYLPQHSDDEIILDPNSSIFTVSLGSTDTIIFQSINSDIEIPHTVKAQSLYVMSKQSQSFWTHRIENSDVDDLERYSITLRTVERRFARSSIILGDSNTRYLTFGEGKGTFGFNMPGQRVYTPRLDNINPMDCAGYSNIFIHCGLNDLKHNIPPADCFMKLKTKIDAIRQISPRSRITVSPILPTKNRYLNGLACAFNRCLFNYVDSPCLDRVKYLNFDNFCNNEGLLDESLGRYNNPSDQTHLGKMGVRVLASLMKDCIMGSRVDGRSYSGVASVRSRSDTAMSKRGERVVVSRSERSERSVTMLMEPHTANNQTDAPAPPP